MTTGERRVRAGDGTRGRRGGRFRHGDAMFGFGCGAFASEHRLGTVDRAKRAASARPSRANVGGVSGGVSVSVASPPRWNVVANVAGASHRRGSLRGGESNETARRTKSRLKRRRNPRSPRVDVPRRPSRSRRFGIDATFRARVFDVVVVAAKRGRVRETPRRRYRPRRSNSACRAARRRATGPPWGCAAAYLRVRARARNRRRRGARPTSRRRRWRARRCSRVFDWAARARR